MKTLQLLVVALLVTGAAFAQSDNRYCNNDNTWLGTSATNPVLHDGPAALPQACYNTDPANTPSPGPIVRVQAGDSLQRAYDSAECGSTLLLAHGATWNDPFTFTAKNCDDEHYITIKTDGLITAPGERITPEYVSQMATLNMSTRAGLKAVGDHIRFIGIHWTKGQSGIFYFLPALLKGSNEIIFDRNYVHCNVGEECQHGITINTGKFIAIIDSYMDEFHCTTQTACDSQAISGGTSSDGSVLDSGPVKIVNNFLEASTENILFGGAQADGPGPNDVEIRRNLLYKNPLWNPSDPNYLGTKYIVKNSLELKNGSRMLIEGNVLENNWGGYSQRGYAILFTPKNQASGNKNICPDCEVADVTFRYNIVRNSGGFISVASSPNANGAFCRGMRRISIHDNIADGLQYPTCYGCGTVLNQISSGYDPNHPIEDSQVASDFSIRNNTIIAIGDLSAPKEMSALMTINGVPPGVPTVQASNISFRDNIASTQKSGIATSGGGASNCFTYAKPQKPVNTWPICWIGSSPFSGNVLVNYPSATTDWPPDNMFAPNWATVGFDNFADGVYSLPQDSPYAGKGANTDVVSLATFGVREGVSEAPTKGKKPSAPSRGVNAPSEERGMSLWSEFMATIYVILLILAVVSFLGAAVHVEPQRVSLMPLGLFFWALAILLLGR